MLYKYSESIKMLNQWRNAHSMYSDVVFKPAFRTLVKLWCHNYKSHPPHLIRKHGGWCLLRPVMAEQSEQDGLWEGDLKENKMEYSERDWIGMCKWLVVNGYYMGRLDSDQKIQQQANRLYKSNFFPKGLKWPFSHCIFLKWPVLQCPTTDWLT